jgi:hypothetical protein
MTYPTVHLNGTSKGSLEEQLRDAYDAVQVAMDKLSDAAPNGRDYYPQSPDAYYQAREEHCARHAEVDGCQKRTRGLGRASRIRIDGWRHLAGNLFAA